MPKVLGIIPARLESTRLPGKLLLAETGKPLIVHTIEQALKAKLLDEVIVATDSPEIAAACKEICPIFLTELDHINGTSRCAEVADLMTEFDHFVNIQADEPEIQPDHIDILATEIVGGKHAVATLATPDKVYYYDPLVDVVKVVTSRHQNAMYFSRGQIPYRVDDWGGEVLRHIGIYAYRAETLAAYRQMPVSPLETEEDLEQLRFLWNEVPIHVHVVGDAGHGINSENDYDAFVQRYRNRPAE